ncbi:MAG: TIGR03960 family B12-binding radical SAM protein [Polyangiaceae bacterium]|nr:TIGR03960 family B12-binding radical SAM protein [Polyangiaceae bacterium]
MTSLLDHPYAKFLPSVLKPNRYTGQEHGTRVKDWQAVQARVCLAFPDVYDIGMSHLGYRILYRILNDDPRTLAERCYTPWPDMGEALMAHGKLLVSLESARPLSDFDVVGFSLQFELTYTNILYMLDLGGVPLRSEHRGESDPLVVAGGPVGTHAEPMAAFFDAILIGDGEEALTEIALLWTDLKREGVPREQRLERLAQIGGVYVPSLYDTVLDADTGLEVAAGPKPGKNAPFPIVRRLLTDLNRFPFPDDGPVGGPEAIFDRMSIEVARGCTEGCRFCQAGMIYRPVRERDPQTVVDTVISALEKSGQDEVSLTSLSTADVSCISPLIKQLVEKTAPERVSLSVASLRAYGLSEDLLDDMRKVRASGLTFAPEAGTQRMRDVINKNVTEEQLMETAQRIFSRGFSKMKLYFIIGLPTETDEDVVGIVNVGKNALQVGKRVGKRPEVTVSVSTHVPKPHTPFQWCAQDPLDEIWRKQAILRSEIQKTRGLKLRTHDARTTVLEGIFARGDRALGNVIEAAYLAGARFDSWDDHCKMDVWKAAFERFGIQVERYLGTLPVRARLPWDHFDIGLEDGFLAREYQKSLKNRLSPPCGKVAGMFVHHTNVAEAAEDKRKLVCYDCGIACDMTAMRSRRVAWLDKMGAKEPNQRIALPVLDTRNPKHPEQFRPDRAGSDRVERIRFRFAKTGAMALLGHLDLIRELPRVIRRAGVRTAYTKGFNPRPDMSFGPALGLGIVSLDEYLDAKLLDPPPAHELLERLNASVAGGLFFLDARPLVATEKSVTRVIDEARYLLALDTKALTAKGGSRWLLERIDAFLASEKAPIERSVKGGKKIIDARQGVLSVRLGGTDAFDLLERANVRGTGTVVEVMMRVDPSGAVRMRELVEALTGDPLFPFTALRTALLSRGNSPMAAPQHLPTALEQPEQAEPLQPSAE